jgi:TRAP-type C4-dicarboxylate transport system permease small subunit
MSGENIFSSFPTAPPPPPPSGQKKRRSPLVLGGMIFAISPLLFSLVASIFVDNAFNESTALGTAPLLMFLTLPIGFVIVIVGLATRARDKGNRNQ